MAERNFSRDLAAMQKGLIFITGEATIGASGAVTLVAARSKGVKSITKNAGAGDYTVVFGTPGGVTDKYQNCLFFDVNFIQTDATTEPAAPDVGIVSRNVASGAGVNFVCADAETPAGTNPASGETMLFFAVLSNSTAL